MKQKLIKDTIHGYIKIPENYCRKIIDTEVFQRLRRIEQTSIRSVFPCAHHDRFVHSLGTYHLGKIAVDAIFENSDDIIKELNIDEKDIKLLKTAFEIACLLHDCGHAPFSHIFEDYFVTANELEDLLMKNSDDEDFKEDLSTSESKPHEKVSAYLILTYFKDNIKEIDPDIDINLIMRMIIGCRYKKKDEPKYQIKNCLIKLLNGDVIDVDKLDYAARDRWASGYNASTVDMERLISSFQICKMKEENRYVFSIRKSAMSEVESLIDSRNFLHMWVINHHKVKYNQYLLSKSVDSMLKLMCPNDSDSVLKKIFNVKSIIERQEIEGNIIFQLTDDDIIYLLKKYCHNNEYFKEWISREHTLKPLWKSYAEYKEMILKDINVDNKNPEQMKVLGEKAVKKVFKNDPFYVEVVKQKLYRIAENNLFIKTSYGFIDYYKVALRKSENIVINPYLYVYVKEENLGRKNEIINEIRNMLS
jgi:HD superfamily phosphohydrolase